jgi:hypothetical protein
MEDNFESQLVQLQKQINELKKEADILQKTNPANAVSNARKACEAICKHICIKSGLIKNWRTSPQSSLYDMIQLIDQNGIVPRHLLDDIRFIQRKGNTVVHSFEKINPEDAKPVLNALSNLVNWYFSGTTLQNISQEDQGKQEELKQDIKQDSFKETIKETYKKPWFVTVATAVMAATGTAIAAKVLKK